VFIFATIKDEKKRGRLEKLYIAHASSMYKVACRILDDEHLAQDAVHEAFINISNNFEKIIKTDCNKMRALFVIIVRNVSINMYNRRKKQCSVSFEELEGELSETGQPNIEEILINKETFTRLVEITNELHPSYADILSLKYFYYYEDEEIAGILDIKPENFRTRLHRARHSLIKLLSQEQGVKNHD